jgi:hypothetical protein
MPLTIIEHVDVLGTTVPGEGQQGCVRRHDVGGFVGLRPALATSNLSPARFRRIASAIWLRAAFCVHKNSTTGLLDSFIFLRFPPVPQNPVMAMLLSN